MNYVMIFTVVVILFCFTVFTGAPFVPSFRDEIRNAFKKLYPLSRADFVIDLGAGDGRVLAVASEFKVKSLGVELNPLIALYARWRLRKNKNAKIVIGRMENIEFPPETTVVYTFTDTRFIEKSYQIVKKEAKRLNKTIYFISNGFSVAGEKPEKTFRTYYLYKVKP